MRVTTITQMTSPDTANYYYYLESWPPTLPKETKGIYIREGQLNKFFEFAPPYKGIIHLKDKVQAEAQLQKEAEELEKKERALLAELKAKYEK